PRRRAGALRAATSGRRAGAPHAHRADGVGSARARVRGALGRGGPGGRLLRRGLRSAHARAGVGALRAPLRQPLRGGRLVSRSDANASRTDPDPGANYADWVGRVLDGRYRIEGLLGEGGMGAVFVAEHLKLRKKVAVK